MVVLGSVSLPPLKLCARTCLDQETFRCMTFADCRLLILHAHKQANLTAIRANLSDFQAGLSTIYCNLQSAIAVP